jgi:hypothetical protein
MLIMQKKDCAEEPTKMQNVGDMKGGGGERGPASLRATGLA